MVRLEDGTELRHDEYVTKNPSTLVLPIGQFKKSRIKISQRQCVHL